MGKMSELAAELAELKRCGEVLISISETLTEMFSGTDAEAAAEPKAEEKPAKKVEKKQKAKEVTLAEVRAVLADKSRQGHTAEVKDLLAKYGGQAVRGGRVKVRGAEGGSGGAGRWLNTRFCQHHRRTGG